jgi:hypothetical protein
MPADSMALPNVLKVPLAAAASSRFSAGRTATGLASWGFVLLIMEFSPLKKGFASVANRKRPKPQILRSAEARGSVRRVKGKTARLSGRYDLAS